MEDIEWRVILDIEGEEDEFVMTGLDLVDEQGAVTQLSRHVEIELAKKYEFEFLSVQDFDALLNDQVGMALHSTMLIQQAIL
jgi:hypothetical protein